MIDKRIYNAYKDMFIESLMDDTKHWKVEHMAAAGCSWSTYYSPDYGEISFFVDDLNFGCGVYIDGRVSFSFRVLPFTQLSKAIKIMKRYVIKKQVNEYQNKLIDKLCEKPEGGILWLTRDLGKK